MADADDDDRITDPAEAMRERFRRLHAAIETHPYLSGLVTNEHQAMLRLIWTDAYDVDPDTYPGGEPPNYALLLDV